MPSFGPINNAGTYMFVKTAKAVLTIPRFTATQDVDVCGNTVSHTFGASVDAKYRPDCTTLLLDYINFSIAATLAVGETGDAFTGSGLTLKAIQTFGDIGVANAAFTGAGYTPNGPAFEKKHTSGTFVEFTGTFSTKIAYDVCKAVIGSRNKLTIARYGFDQDTCTPKLIANVSATWLELDTDPADIATVTAQSGIGAGLVSLEAGGIPAIASWTALEGTTKVM